MGQRYSHPSLEERHRLRGLMAMSLSIGEIARSSGRRWSTIRRALERDRCADGCGSDSAGRRASARQLSASKIALPRRRDHVEDRLALGWSPERMWGGWRS